MILAGDVGGTKTRLALYSPDASPRVPLREHRAPSRDYPSLEALALEFLGADRRQLTSAAFGIAGPVVGNRCETTNLPWTLDGAEISRKLGGAPVRLFNDLEATGWGLSQLEENELRVVQAGRPATGNRALIAAGTGLGEALIVWDGVSHQPNASEGGHVDFASRDAFEDELHVWLRNEYRRVSYERILSGAGLVELYRFLTVTRRGTEPPGMAERFASDADPAAVISSAALDGSCERARLALDRWVRVYGAEAGNLALKALAVNGVFVGGGIAPRVASFICSASFTDAFRDKGRLTTVLENIPVHLILDDRAALWGAAAYAMSHAARGSASPTT